MAWLLGLQGRINKDRISKLETKYFAYFETFSEYFKKISKNKTLKKIIDRILFGVSEFSFDLIKV